MGGFPVRGPVTVDPYLRGCVEEAQTRQRLQDKSKGHGGGTLQGITMEFAKTYHSQRLSPQEFETVIANTQVPQHTQRWTVFTKEWRRLLAREDIVQVLTHEHMELMHSKLSQESRMLMEVLIKMDAVGFTWEPDYVKSPEGQYTVMMLLINVFLQHPNIRSRAPFFSENYGLKLANEAGIPLFTFIEHIEEMYQAVFWCMEKHPLCGQLQVKVGLWSNWSVS
mmetsp:Transcript_87520/g.141728  ORF Transcript_87520/g.141728 Transcript_87520/m.141728 type:complete len:223 (+) Transcript_87520:116-784(+)